MPKDEFDLSPCAGHNVQFYEDDRFLCSAVAEFIGAGLNFGNPIALITTQQHRDAIARELMGRGQDMHALMAAGRAKWLDAHETLSLFMQEDMPNRDKFIACMAAIIEEGRLGCEHLSLRVFGEMVDLLARGGNLEGAVRLEELWNELGKTHGFALMCAYSMGNFYREEHWKHFQKICEQ